MASTSCDNILNQTTRNTPYNKGAQRRQHCELNASICLSFICIQRQHCYLRQANGKQRNILGYCYCRLLPISRKQQLFRKSMKLRRVIVLHFGAPRNCQCPKRAQSDILQTYRLSNCFRVEPIPANISRCWLELRLASRGNAVQSPLNLFCSNDLT